MSQLPTIDTAIIQEFLDVLHGDDPYEIRIPKCPKKSGGDYRRTVAGYFSDHELAVQHIAKWSEAEPTGIYTTLNEIDKSIIARSVNKLTFDLQTTTSAAQVVRRKWLVFDIDSVKPSGVSATDEQLQAAKHLADALAAWLCDKGWPAPLWVMSGNGYYLLYRIDLPNDPESTEMIKRILHACGDRFDSESAEVDRKPFDPNRIVKIAGTVARKGDDLREIEGVPDQPHRQAYFWKSQGDLELVSQGALESLAIEFADPHSMVHDGNAIADADSHRRYSRYLSKMEPAIEGSNGSDRLFAAAAVGRKFGLAPIVIQQVLETEYNHRCQPEWTVQEIRHKVNNACDAVDKADQFGCLSKSRYETTSPKNNNLELLWTHDQLAEEVQPDAGTADSLGIKSAIQLLVDHPRLREPLIHGVVRRGETLNIIAPPKTGKTWLTLGMAHAIATGRDWLGFETTQAKVLLIDNELHPEVLSDRLDRVCDAHMESIPEEIDVLSIRGQGLDIGMLSAGLAKLPSEQYGLIVIDALYRALPEGTNESDNGQVTQIYNLVDAMAATTNAAIAIVHHASKGDQSSKGVTDVGSGAGAISRAADSHLIIRPHTEDGHAVVEMVCRSWPSQEPKSIGFQFPIWSVSTIEPEVKTPKTAMENKQSRQDREAVDAITDVLMTRQGKPFAFTEIRDKTGFGINRVKRILLLMEAGTNPLVPDVSVKRRKNRKTGRSCDTAMLVSPGNAPDESIPHTGSRSGM